MKQKRLLPAFKSEAEEAEWWYKNRAGLDKDLVDAAKKGKLKRLDAATLKTRLAASKSRVVSIRLPENDIELARQHKQLRSLLLLQRGFLKRLRIGGGFCIRQCACAVDHDTLKSRDAAREAFREDQLRSCLCEQTSRA